MGKTILSLVSLGVILSFTQIQASDMTDSKGPSAEDLQKIEKLTPTLAQIKATKAPWGLNLCLVEERGKKARKLSVDKWDFSSRVTLLQKHKSKAQQLSKEMEELGKKISEFNESNFVTKALKKTEIEQAQEQMNKLHDEVKANALKMNAMAKTVKAKTGLTDEEIIALPDSNKWKEMKATECNSSTQAKTTPAPQRPQMAAPKKEQEQAPQRQQWQRAEVSVR
jgi:predicted transcriptional regulator